jgi:hypothetical protein
LQLRSLNIADVSLKANVSLNPTLPGHFCAEDQSAEKRELAKSREISAVIWRV